MGLGSGVSGGAQFACHAIGTCAFHELFCAGHCLRRYRELTSQQALRQYISEQEHAVCQMCSLDCRKVLQVLDITPVFPACASACASAHRAVTTRLRVVQKRQHEKRQRGGCGVGGREGAVSQFFSCGRFSWLAV